MNRYDDQWAAVYAAEEAAEFRRRMTAWESAHRVAGFFTAAREARAEVAR